MNNESDKHPGKKASDQGKEKAFSLEKGLFKKIPDHIVNNIFFSFRLFIGFGLIFIIYRSVDPVKFKETLNSTDLRILIWGVASIFLAVLASTASWKALLIPLKLKISWKHALNLRLISFFFNMMFPSGIAGDVWRGFIFGIESKNLGGSFAAMLVEKWTSFASLAAVAVVAFIMGYRYFQQIGLFLPLLHFVLLMITATFISIALFPWFVNRGVEFFSQFGVMNPYFIGVKSLDVYKEKKTYVWQSLAFALLSPVLESAAFYFASLSLGYRLPFIIFFVMIPFIRVINKIPVSVNAIGTQDIAMVLFLASYGVNREAAFSISLLAHVVRTFVILFGGVSYIAGVASQKSGKNISMQVAKKLKNDKTIKT